MKTLTIKDDDGTPVTLKVGDFVGFKCDVEQGGRITAINGRTVTVIAREGGYVHQDCHEDCDGCSLAVDIRAEDLWIN